VLCSHFERSRLLDMEEKKELEIRGGGSGAGRNIEAGRK
jgi:hypothetical protein